MFLFGTEIAVYDTNIELFGNLHVFFKLSVMFLLYIYPIKGINFNIFPLYYIFCSKNDEKTAFLEQRHL